MIRYVVAAILVVAIFGIGFAALDHAAAMNSERQVEDDVTDLESAAISLYEEEELAPRGSPGPRRSVTIDLPGDTYTTAPVDRVVVRPISENRTVVTFSVPDRPRTTVTVDVPTEINGSASRLVLQGSGTRSLLLRLVRDADGDPIVRIYRR